MASPSRSLRGVEKASPAERPTGTDHQSISLAPESSVGWMILKQADGHAQAPTSRDRGAVIRSCESNPGGRLGCS